MATPIDVDRLRVLMIGANAAVDAAASEVVERVVSASSPTYPPNGELTREEQEALRALGEAHLPILHRMLADAAATALFHVFALIDAVGDPETYDGTWLPLVLAEPNDMEAAHQQMLHDEFFDAYWDWKHGQSSIEER